MKAGDTMRDEALDYFIKLTGRPSDFVDIPRLTSAQRARFASWCQTRGLAIDSFRGVESTANGNEGESSPFNHVKSSGAATSAAQALRIGIDIQQVAELFPERIRDLKGNSEMLAIFTDREIAYAEGKQDPFATLAGVFAAKEALLKAGAIELGGRNLNAIEIGHDSRGAPVCANAQLSISHSGGFAIAVAALGESAPAALPTSIPTPAMQAPVKPVEKRRSIAWLLMGGVVIYALLRVAEIYLIRFDGS